MKNVLTPARSVIASALIVGLAVAAQAQSEFRRTLDRGEAATKRAGDLQQQINQLDDTRQGLIGEFRVLIQRKQSADLFANRQQDVVDGQLIEIASIEDQLTRVDEITAETIPMMEDMITDLEAFIDADLPFRLNVRKKRIEDLKAAMVNSRVPTPEAYRLIIEAYQAEMEYGSTINTWEEEIDLNGDGVMVNVDMFQYGRLSLVYLTQDQKKSARYDRELGEFVALPKSYNADIRQAIRIAEEKAQQEIMPAPITKLTLAEAPAQ
ncbi:MAG: DUF3450 domain-containing protein [Pseudomonadota bacterium]